MKPPFGVEFAFCCDVGGGGELEVAEVVEVMLAPSPRGGDGEEFGSDEPVEVLTGSSRGVLRRFFHLARRFWNQT